jgi:hypothetical protein
MRKLASISAAFVVLLLWIPVIGRKYSVPLMSNGKVVATAKRPCVLPWKDNEFSVYVGKSKLFSLWGSAFEFPLFIHPFSDGQRFLCIDDDDTAVLVFVVDFAPSPASATNASEWPPNDDTRRYLAQRATNIVMDTKGLVRLPTRSEVQEVSGHLTTLTGSQFRSASFPVVDLGLYRGYWSKEALLAAVDTNRQACWP